jgi:hypothetical protein
MQMWKKVAIGTVSALTIAGGANLAALAAGDDPARVVDVRGPCDEAEHANDPQCAAQQVREDDARERGEDRRGREDERRGREDENEREAEDRDEDEHEADDDNSGPGSSNRGPSDNSGPGSGGDDHGDHGGHDD